MLALRLLTRIRIASAACIVVLALVNFWLPSAYKTPVTGGRLAAINVALVVFVLLLVVQGADEYSARTLHSAGAAFLEGRDYSWLPPRGRPSISLEPLTEQCHRNDSQWIGSFRFGLLSAESAEAAIEEVGIRVVFPRKNPVITVGLVNFESVPENPSATGRLCTVSVTLATTGLPFDSLPERGRSLFYFVPFVELSMPPDSDGRLFHIPMTKSVYLFAQGRNWATLKSLSDYHRRLLHNEYRWNFRKREGLWFLEMLSRQFSQEYFLVSVRL